jgi:predicted regulator of Ras-like GTPase activity (Roadblock/LC7/MglB family)
VASGLSIEQGRLLTRAISDLLVQSEAQGAVLCDDIGNVLAQAAMGEGDTVQTIAALGAGAFVATRELAALIGEPAFQSICHQGAAASIYVRSVASGFLLFVIFTHSTTAGLVRLYVDRLSEELMPTLQQVARQTSVGAGGAGVTFELDAAASVFPGASAR